ncbi:MAG: sigma-70 family RNA polymerase sigma factor [Woeseiaceae bacterium]|nr:sigma-70 family RNA polymerase sigma factor [Woeseiaceae bacterium]
MKIEDPPSKADFHRVIDARSDRWYSACLRITRDPDLAADAVQDALLSAWQKREQFRHSSRLDTWIHRIAVNAALGLLRKARPGTFEALEADVASGESGPEQRLQDYELESELAANLAKLTDIERVCFVLKHLEQWRAREIAEELATNEGRVKQAVFRAVRKLQDSMQNMTRALA